MEKKIRESYNDKVLHEAMRRYGIRPEDIQLLDGFESFLYEYRQGNDQRILRISHSLHRDAAAIRGEVDWLRYLSGQGLPVAYAVSSLAGELVEVLDEGGGCFSATAYVRAPGGPPRREDWQNGLLLQVGQLIGKMNALAKSYRPFAPRRRQPETGPFAPRRRQPETGPFAPRRRQPETGPFAPRGRRPHLIEDIEGFERFLPAGEEAVAQKYCQMVAGLRELPTGPDVYGLVHQDVHSGNFFVQDGRITLFDFDDVLYGWYAYDLAIALFYVLPHDCTGAEKLAAARQAWAELLAGYRRENDLPARWIAEIPRFLKLREIDLYIAIHRSMDLTHLDPWCTSYMQNRREKILNDVPYVDIPFI